MKKIMFCVAIVLFVFDTIISVDYLMRPSDPLVLFTVVGIWVLYVLFVIATFLNVRHRDELDLIRCNRRRLQKESRRFWKKYREGAK